MSASISENPIACQKLRFMPPKSVCQRMQGSPRDQFRINSDKPANAGPVKNRQTASPVKYAPMNGAV